MGKHFKSKKKLRIGKDNDADHPEDCFMADPLQAQVIPFLKSVPPLYIDGLCRKRALDRGHPHGPSWKRWLPFGWG